MFCSGKWLVAALAICMLAAQEATAGIGFQPVSPDELKLKGEPLAPGASAIILYRQVDRDDNGRTSHEDNYLRIKILTEEGRKYANVEIPFLKGRQNIADLRARTIRTDGSTVGFAGKAFDKELVKGKGLKYLAKTFTLPDVQTGTVIEYSYTIDFDEHMLYDSHWILSEELFTRKAQFSLKPYNGYSSIPFSIHWSWLGLPEGAIPKQGADHIIRMEANNIPAFQVEDYMPPPNELRSRVDFIYEQGNPGKDQILTGKPSARGGTGIWRASLEKRR